MYCQWEAMSTIQDRDSRWSRFHDWRCSGITPCLVRTCYGNLQILTHHHILKCFCELTSQDVKFSWVSKPFSLWVLFTTLFNCAPTKFDVAYIEFSISSGILYTWSMFWCKCVIYLAHICGVMCPWTNTGFNSCIGDGGADTLAKLHGCNEISYIWLW